MKTKTYFAFRVDVWDEAGDNIVEHVAGVDDLLLRERHTSRRRRLSFESSFPCAAVSAAGTKRR